jgi:hypothetical protein
MDNNKFERTVSINSKQAPERSHSPMLNASKPEYGICCSVALNSLLCLRIALTEATPPSVANLLLARLCSSI